MLPRNSVISRFHQTLSALLCKGFSEKVLNSDELFRIKQNKSVISVSRGDLTAETTDVIVNAANSDLLHGGGVAGAIRVKGGAVIQTESNTYVRNHGRVETGQVAVTTAGGLKCKKIIHAVGPIWRGGGANENKLLRDCVLNSLSKASELKFTSISIPAISTGIYGFPKKEAAEIFAQSIYDYLHSEKETTLTRIRLIDMNEIMINHWIEELRRVFKQET